MRSCVIVSRRFAVVFSLSLIFGLSDVGAQERFFTSPSRGGADGARAAVQLQQETNRGIAHEVSITALSTDLTSVSATASSAVSQVSSLQAAVNVSLSSAGDVTCGNAGMLMGPSHTIAVNKCIPSLTIAPTGRVVLTQGLKLGSEGNCDGSSAGTLRYEAAQRLVQFCDGTAWQEVGAAPAVSGPFTAVTGAEPSTAITSNAVTVTGFAGVRTATATGGATIMVNGFAVGSSANVNPGDSVALRVTSSASFDTAVNVGFSVTSISANWSVTTRSQDTTPNSFSFTALTNQAVSTTVMSDIVTVSGFDGPLTITVAGTGSPQLQINGGAWATSAAVNGGNTVRLRLTTRTTGASTNGANVTLGSYSTSWTAGTESYAWVTGTWSACTSGNQTRSVECRGATSNALGANALCTSSAPASSQTCVATCIYPYQGGCATGPNPTVGSLLAMPVRGPSMRWSNWGTNGGVTSTTDGASNTAALAACGGNSACPTSIPPSPTSTRFPAASYCANLVHDGYSDWYLPAKDELNQLFVAKEAIGNFTPFYAGERGWPYWSSTAQSDSDLGVWHQRFDYYAQYPDDYGMGYYVRCVRRAI